VRSGLYTDAFRQPAADFLSLLQQKVLNHCAMPSGYSMPDIPRTP
jgi:hypothetical protein